MHTHAVDSHAVGRRRRLFLLLAHGIVLLTIPERADLVRPWLHVQLAEVGVHCELCLVFDRQNRIADRDQHRDLHRGREDSDMRRRTSGSRADTGELVAIELQQLRRQECMSDDNCLGGQRDGVTRRFTGERALHALVHVFKIIGALAQPLVL